MFLLLRSRGDLNGEAVLAVGRTNGQRHFVETRLGGTLFSGDILRGRLRTARGERRAGER